MSDEPPAGESPESDPARWLEEHGLDGAEVLAVLDNEVVDAMEPWQLRALHAFLQARWELDHPDPD